MLVRAQFHDKQPVYCEHGNYLVCDWTSHSNSLDYEASMLEDEIKLSCLERANQAVLFPTVPSAFTFGWETKKFRFEKR